MVQAPGSPVHSLELVFEQFRDSPGISEAALVDFIADSFSPGLLPPPPVRIFVAACRRILMRLAADRPKLAHIFGIPESATVIGLRQLGDRHGGGNTVALIEFDASQPVVYKPRSLAADRAYHELLEWMGRTLGRSFRTPKVLDQQTYGWSEFVSDDSCTDTTDAEEFYYRLGAQLCLSALIKAKDVHAENVIAAGSHPVIVDLECSLEPDWPNPFRKTPADDDVIETMILPRPVIFEGQTYDFSALAGDPSAPGPCAGFCNRPRLNGSALCFRSYQRPFSNGFAGASEALLQNKCEIPIASFRGIETRFVFRGTFNYFRLLSESLDHPDRSVFLSAATMQDIPRPELALIARSEARDMEEFDVPIFRIRTDQSLVFDSRGEPVLELACATGFESLRARIESYSAKDYARGLALISESFAGSAKHTMRI